MPKIQVPGLRDNDGVLFKPVPAGTYICRCVRAEKTETSKGSHQLHTKWEIEIPPAELENSEKYVGRSIVDYEICDGSVEFATSLIKQMLNATGVEVAEDDTFDTADLYGKVAKLVVSVRERELEDGTKEPRNQVRAYLAAE